ncbi:MAG TPA: ATP-dependent DNA ligase [Galbitalea sp.]
MGKLLYGEAGIELAFDDRELAHLQLVIGSKLRRRESFFFSWKSDPSYGEGRNSVWLDASIPLYFKYFGSKPPTINREWIDLLTQSANSAQGMQLMSEPQPAQSTAEPARVRVG